MNLAQALDLNAARRPQKAAIVTPSQTITQSEFLLNHLGKKKIINFPPTNTLTPARLVSLILHIFPNPLDIT